LKKFFSTLARTDGFAWRNVRDSKSRSFHGIGLAVDVLPKGYYQKIIYWRWQKQLDPEGWMLTPISKRWCPPQEIIDIFEDETGEALEVWVKNLETEAVYMYLLFPYDSGVIEY
jgi:hypothetical protein